MGLWHTFWTVLFTTSVVLRNPNTTTPPQFIIRRSIPVEKTSNEPGLAPGGVKDGLCCRQTSAWQTVFQPVARSSQREMQPFMPTNRERPVGCSRSIEFGHQHAVLLKAMIKEQVRLDGLLFSSDTDVLGVMSQILDTFAIKTEVFGELDSAVDAVTHRRLDTVIVDWSGVHDPNRVVRAARRSSPNSNSTIVAMVDQSSEAHALLAGANFMIHKPMDHDHAQRCMRAAYGTMLQNRRRAARVPVDLPVVVRVIGGKDSMPKSATSASADWPCSANSHWKSIRSSRHSLHFRAPRV